MAICPREQCRWWHKDDECCGLIGMYGDGLHASCVRCPPFIDAYGRRQVPMLASSADHFERKYKQLQSNLLERKVSWFEAYIRPWIPGPLLVVGFLSVTGIWALINGLMHLFCPITALNGVVLIGTSMLWGMAMVVVLWLSAWDR